MTLTPVMLAVAEGLARDNREADRLRIQIENAMENGPWAMEALDIEEVWSQLSEVQQRIDERRYFLPHLYHPWIVEEVLREAIRLYYKDLS